MLSVSGAVPLESTRASHAALATRCAAHCGAAFRVAGEMASAEECCVSPAAAEMTTRSGVTAITLDGGVSKSFPTSQLMRTARPAREARPLRVVDIE